VWGKSTQYIVENGILGCSSPLSQKEKHRGGGGGRGDERKGEAQGGKKEMKTTMGKRWVQRAGNHTGVFASARGDKNGNVDRWKPILPSLECRHDRGDEGGSRAGRDQREKGGQKPSGG